MKKSQGYSLAVEDYAHDHMLLEAKEPEDSHHMKQGKAKESC